MRVLEIVLRELASDVLKNEEKLQRLINSNDGDLDKSIEKIKSLLKEITQLEDMIEKWKSYIGPIGDENNNNESKN
tara:strand:+ start:867 stop:1094 length:228 start_codon:yes stop_codon:yes gene_type:complete